MGRTTRLTVRYPQLWLALALVSATGPALAETAQVRADRLRLMAEDAEGVCADEAFPAGAVRAACAAALSYRQALTDLGACVDETADGSGCKPGDKTAAVRPERVVVAEPEPEVIEAPGEALPDADPLPEADARRDDTVSVAEAEEPLPPADDLASDETREPARSLEEPDEALAADEGADEGDDEGVPDRLARHEAEPLEEVAPRRVSRRAGGGWTRGDTGPAGGTVLLPGNVDLVRRDEGLRNWASADGSLNIALSSQPIDGSFADYRRQVRAGFGNVTYSARGSDWFVLSGYDRGNIYYLKVLRGEACGTPVAHHLAMHYPPERKREFDAAVTRIARSLRGRGDC